MSFFFKKKNTNLNGLRKAYLKILDFFDKKFNTWLLLKILDHTENK